MMPGAIWLFPPQTSGCTGMGSSGLLRGSALFARRLAFASALLGCDLERAIAEGPDHVLRTGERSSLAVLCVGSAAAEELLARGLRPDALCGYSLGFYTAATVSGALDFEDAARLVLAIERESDARFAALDADMAAVTGIKIATLTERLAPWIGRGDLAVAIVNTQAQAILAGSAAALEEALAAVRADAIKAERLGIGRPYHSGAMAPVAAAIARLLEEVPVREPAIPLIDPASGSPIQGAKAVRAQLAGQLARVLDWHGTIGALAASGMRRSIEMPPGSALTRMVRWTAREAEAIVLDSAEGPTRLFAPVGEAGA